MVESARISSLIGTGSNELIRLNVKSGVCEPSVNKLAKSFLNNRVMITRGPSFWWSRVVFLSLDETKQYRRKSWRDESTQLYTDLRENGTHKKSFPLLFSFLFTYTSFADGIEESSFERMYFIIENNFFK